MDIKEKHTWKRIMALNAKRAGYNPPCVELKKCIECSSKERVCNYLSIIEGQAEPNRIQLCIVNMECGF